MLNSKYERNIIYVYIYILECVIILDKLRIFFTLRTSEKKIFVLKKIVKVYVCVKVEYYPFLVHC